MLKLILQRLMDRKVSCIVMLWGFSIGSFAEGIGFQEYSSKIQSLNSACQEERMFGFSGFCLSKEYGKPAYENSTQVSIHMGLEMASFEYFLGKCEHSDSVSAMDAIAKAKKVLEAEKFFDEIRPQTEALRNYVGRFYSCKSKIENDAIIANRTEWLDHMSSKYSVNGGSESEPPVKTVASRKPAKVVVECILSHYQTPVSSFFADGLLEKDGSIVISLIAPKTLPLAKVKDVSNGSVTLYANIETERFKSIPKPMDFTNAVIDCQ